MSRKKREAPPGRRRAHSDPQPRRRDALQEGLSDPLEHARDLHALGGAQTSASSTDDAGDAASASSRDEAALPIYGWTRRGEPITDPHDGRLLVSEESSSEPDSDLSDDGWAADDDLVGVIIEESDDSLSSWEDDNERVLSALDRGEDVSQLIDTILWEPGDSADYPAELKCLELVERKKWTRLFEIMKDLGDPGDPSLGAGRAGDGSGLGAHARSAAGGALRRRGAAVDLRRSAHGR